MSFITGGGGGGGEQHWTYYQNIAQDIENEQRAEKRRIDEATAALAAETAKKDAAAKLLKDVADNKESIRRNNPTPFMTTGWTGLGLGDARALGAGYTLG